jgi:hypothetical protein
MQNGREIKGKWMHCEECIVSWEVFLLINFGRSWGLGMVFEPKS